MRIGLGRTDRRPVRKSARGEPMVAVGTRPGPAGPLAAGVRPRGLPPTRLTILIERAASTLALGRLIRRDAEGLERQIHRTLLTALLDHSRPVDEVALRAKALGVVLDRRHLVGVVVRHRADDPGGRPVGGRRARRPARPGCATSPRRSARRCGRPS